MSNENSSLARDLAKFAVGARPSHGALEATRLSLFDWAACARAGVQEPVAKILRAQVLEEGGAPEAALAGVPERVPARAAAMVNAATGHALDYDDTHFAHIGHTSAVVMPVVLALAGRHSDAGGQLLHAAAIGAEGAVRTGLWLGRGHYQAGFHQTATAGAFGATLAACTMLALSEGETTEALSLASTRASGLKAQFGTMGKPWNAGLAASCGVEAALLAGRGMKSRAAALDGPQGFHETHAGSGSASEALEGIGDVWKIEGVSYKFHACCHGLHAMLEALAATLPEIGGEIEKLEIKAHPRWQTVCNIADPKSGLEAKFSFRQAAALMVSGHDTAAPECFSDALVLDPQMQGMRARIKVVFSAALGEIEARVRVRLADGRLLEQNHDLSRPLSIENKRARLLAKARVLMGVAQTDTLWRACAGEPDVGAIENVLMARAARV